MARPLRTRPFVAAVALTVALGACGDSRDDADDSTEVSATSATDVVDDTVPPSTEPPSTTVEETVPSTEAPESTAKETVPSTEPPETTAEETVPSTEPPETTDAPTTTAARTTTEAPMTTRAPARTTTTRAPAPSTTTDPAELVLDGSGLGVATFGQTADEVVAALSAVIGPPTEDTGWVDPATISTCDSTELRRVSWGSLATFHGDDGEAGSRRFFTYSYGDVTDLAAEPVGLLTTNGIGLGSSVADLRAAYQAVQVLPGEEGLIQPSFYVDDTFGGLLSGDTDGDVVTVVSGGSGGPFCG